MRTSFSSVFSLWTVTVPIWYYQTGNLPRFDVAFSNTATESTLYECLLLRIRHIVLWLLSFLLINFNQVSNEAQDQDLALFLQITDAFYHFNDFIIEHGLFHTSPTFLLNSYKSRETNFEWRHFNGTKLNYTGHFPVAGLTEGPLDGDWDYTAFSNNEIIGKTIFLD